MNRPSDGGRMVIARPFGVPVDVTPTWFVVAGLITVGFASTVESAIPDIGAWKYAVSLTFALLLYLSVLVHELSHTLVALRAGLPVRRISLHLLGGESEIGKPAETAGREAGIAVAGPLVSLVLAGLAYLVGELLEPETIGRLLARALMVSNLIVGAFNLLPGLPLDGGRVIAAAVWRVTGRRHLGTQVAGWLGRFLAVLVLTAPFVLGANDSRSIDLIDVVFTGLISAFIWVGASQSIQYATVQQRMPGLHARELTRRAVPVEATMPLGEALRRAHEAQAGALVVVSAGGDPIGLVVEAAVTAVPQDRRPWVAVGDFSRRLESGHVLTADLSGEQLLAAMRDHPASEYLVVEPGGGIYGVLTTADVERRLVRS